VDLQRRSLCGSHPPNQDLRHAYWYLSSYAHLRGPAPADEHVHAAAGVGRFPSFDHAVGDPREDDIHITLQHRVILIEGNYLLLGARSPSMQICIAMARFC
jgi:hypothetical protein